MNYATSSISFTLTLQEMGSCVPISAEFVGLLSDDKKFSLLLICQNHTNISHPAQYFILPSFKDGHE